MIKFKTSSGSWKIETPTIERYYQIQSLLALAELNEVQIRIVVALSGAPESEIREMDSSRFESLWSDIETGPLAAKTDEAFQRIIKIDGQEFGFINVAHLTIGELADLDTIKNHPQSEKQLHRLMGVLYRPLVSGDLQGYEIEPHGADGYSDRTQLFLEKMPVYQVLAAIDFFFSYYKSLIKQYDGLFETDDTGDRGGDDDAKPGDDRADIKTARGWAKLFYFLADDDILKVKE